MLKFVDSMNIIKLVTKTKCKEILLRVKYSAKIGCRKIAYSHNAWYHRPAIRYNVCACRTFCDTLFVFPYQHCKKCFRHLSSPAPPYTKALECHASIMVHSRQITHKRKKRADRIAKSAWPALSFSYVAGLQSNLTITFF